MFLDDVTEHNGPLVFIQGSHRHGPVRTALDTQTTSYALWTVDRETVAGLAAEGRLVSATGPAGTALIFGDCLVHGSPPNLSPWDRRIFSVILNPIANAQTERELTLEQALEMGKRRNKSMVVEHARLAQVQTTLSSAAR